jgi:hypothetical protein
MKAASTGPAQGPLPHPSAAAAGAPLLRSAVPAPFRFVVTVPSLQLIQLLGTYGLDGKPGLLEIRQADSLRFRHAPRRVRAS